MKKSIVIVMLMLTLFIGIISVPIIAESDIVSSPCLGQTNSHYDLTNVSHINEYGLLLKLDDWYIHNCKDKTIDLDSESPEADVKIEAKPEITTANPKTETLVAKNKTETLAPKADNTKSKPNNPAPKTDSTKPKPNNSTPKPQTPAAPTPKAPTPAPASKAPTPEPEAPAPKAPTPEPEAPAPKAPTPEPEAPAPKEPAPTPAPEPKPDPIPAAPQGIGSQQTQMLNAVNKERVNAGKKPLKWDGSLAKVAQTKAKDMVDNGYFSHTSPTYGSPFDMIKSSGISYCSAAENLAGSRNVDRAQAGLMKSSGHKKNILSSNFTHMGIGVQKSSTYGYVYVQMFIGK